MVKVKVIEVDLPRKRVALSMRLADAVGEKKSRADGGPRTPREARGQPQRQVEPAGAMAAAFAKLKR